MPEIDMSYIHTGSARKMLARHRLASLARALLFPRRMNHHSGRTSHDPSDETAENAVRSAIAGAKTPVEGLRIKVEAGGCAGLEVHDGAGGRGQSGGCGCRAQRRQSFVDEDSISHL
jgi:hypothetical protein